MGLLDDVRPSIDAVLTDLFSDTSLVREVEYKRYKDRVYDEEKGHTVPVYDSFPIKGVRLSHTVDSVKFENSQVNVGDAYYMFRAQDMPSGLSLSDVIVANSKELTLKAINDGFDFVYLITISGTGL